MKKLSVFDVIGPKMIGPSSSHTAGALRIARIAREFIDGPVQEAVFTLYGSFAETYQGHGTDRALVGGVLGYDTSDIRIRESLEEAIRQEIAYEFRVDRETPQHHANTVEVLLTGDKGQKIRILGVSIGGGEVEIREINGVEVFFRGEYCTLLVQQKDAPGIVAFITQHLSQANINIAFMKLYREGKGDLAYTIIETDDQIGPELVELLTEHEYIYDATLLRGW